jgi:hypothetical protein
MASLLAALFEAILTWWGKRKVVSDRDRATDAQAGASIDSAAIDHTTEVKLDESQRNSAADVDAIRMSAGRPDGVREQRSVVNEAIDRANSGGDL